MAHNCIYKCLLSKSIILELTLALSKETMVPDIWEPESISREAFPEFAVDSQIPSPFTEPGGILKIFVKKTNREGQLSGVSSPTSIHEAWRF